MRRFAMAMAITIAATTATSCAHHHRRDPEVLAEVKLHREWLARLPACDLGIAAIGVGRLRRDGWGRRVAVRGLLELVDFPFCTQMGCEEECCNGCGGDWVLVPVAGPVASGRYKRRISIQRAGEDAPMSWGAMDCQVKALQEMVPKAEVIVTGTFQGGQSGERLVDASLCVVDPRVGPT